MADFGAIPDDGKSDAEAIQVAFNYALANGIPQIRFAPGTYDLSGIEGWDPAPNWAHYHRLFEKSGSYLHLQGARDLELIGAVDAAGNPATRWIKHNDLREYQPQTLAVEKGVKATEQIIFPLTADGIENPEEVGMMGNFNILALGKTKAIAHVGEMLPKRGFIGNALQARITVKE
ncbi:MAG: hypothetical protein ACYTGH_06730 [Planctomycetota bacterium]